MRFIIMVFLTLWIWAINSYGQDTSNTKENNITAEFGFKQGAVHYGATVVKDYDHIGLGGYVFIQTENKSNNVVRAHELVSAGVISKFILLSTPKAQVHFAPGLGFSEIRNFHDLFDINASKSAETFLGAIFKIGAVYSVTSDIKMGLEYSKISNWCEPEVTDFLTEYSSVIMSYDF